MHSKISHTVYLLQNLISLVGTIVFRSRLVIILAHVCVYKFFSKIRRTNVL